MRVSDDGYDDFQAQMADYFQSRRTSTRRRLRKPRPYYRSKKIAAGR